MLLLMILVKDMDNEQPEQAEEVAEKPSTEGEDLEDAGQPAKQPKPLVQSKQESPMKVKEKKVEKKQKTGPSEERIAQKEKEKRNKNAVNSKIANAFGKSGGSGSGKQGSPEGNSADGSVNVSKPERMAVMSDASMDRLVTDNMMLL